MADSDKNILITPNTGQSSEPKIEFVGSSSLPITLKVLDDNSLSWEGGEGQLFSITNNLSSGTIFSVNDISGIPSIEVDADGTVVLAEFSGNVGIGTTSPSHKLTVNGDISGSTIVGSTILGNFVAINTSSNDTHRLLVKQSSQSNNGIRVQGIGSSIDLYGTTSNVATIDMSSTFLIGHTTSKAVAGTLVAGRSLVLKTQDNSALGQFLFDVGSSGVVTRITRTGDIYTIGDITGSLFSGSTAQFTSITGSFSGSGSGITNLNYSNITNPPTIGNATVTISAGNGLTTGGSLTTNQATNSTITLNVGAGTGISVAADSVAIDTSVVPRLSVNNTFTGTNTFGVITASSIDVDTITAREYYTELVSASVIYQSGSTKFGDTSDDIHQFTGSLYISGSSVALTGGSFSGNGSDLTSLNASNISAGTLNSARLPDLVVADFSAAAIQLSSETFSDSDTVLMTAAAVEDRILSKGYTTNVGDITGVTAGTGLSGGGTFGTVILSLDFSELTDMTADITGTTEFILQNGTTESRKAASEIKLSAFNNDSGWTSNAGTVTSIATGNGITGGTITSTGTLGLTGQALALHNLSTNGLVTRTGSGTVAGRTITGGTGITVTNGDGVSGNPSIALTNNSLTIGSTSVSLGGTATTIAGLTSVTSTGFTGSLSGNASTATTATNATNVAVTNDTATNATHYVAFVGGTSGNQAVNVDSSTLTYNPLSNTLTTGRYIGDLFLSSNGTAGSPAFTTGYDLNTGIYFPADDTIAFTEGGVERMRINSSGNVGIGTTNPSQQLEVLGVSPFIRISNAAETEAGIEFVDRDFPTTQYAKITYDSGGGNELKFYVDSTTPAMIIDDSGNIGIGTTSPLSNAILHINAADKSVVLDRTGRTGEAGGLLFTSGSAIELFINSGVNSSLILGVDKPLEMGYANNSFTSANLAFKATATEAFIRNGSQTAITVDNKTTKIQAVDTSQPALTVTGNVDLSDNLAIGLSSPATPLTRLHIRDGTVPTYFRDTIASVLVERGDAHIQIASNDSGGFGSALVLTNGSKNWFIQNRPSDDALDFRYYSTSGNGDFIGSSSSEMTLTNTGYVGIGTTSPKSPLHIKEDAGSTTNNVEGRGFIIERADGDFYWRIGLDLDSTNPELVFALYNSSDVNQKRAWISPDAAGTQLNFTGQHKTSPIDSSLLSSSYIGLIVRSSGAYNSINGNSITINESLPVVELCASRNDKAVFGVISNFESPEEKERIYQDGIIGSAEPLPENDNRLTINSLGEGGIWICNINGNLENGDYITTCEVPGYGMKQDSEFLANYTVAKITCDCDFDLQSPTYICEEFQWEGQTYRRAFVGCTYHCG